jgi:iron complex transport system permease protein
MAIIKILVTNEQKMTEQFHRLIIFSLVGTLLLLATFSLMIGSMGWSPPLGALFVKSSYAILKYRSCRITLAIIAGSSLAASGASLQAIFRNPLADPHLFGISGGAALGASIVIAFLSEHSAIMPSAGAIVGGLCAFILVFFYVHTAKNEALTHCLLVGVLINSLAAAMITLLKTTLPIHKTQNLLFWLVGHISVVEPHQLLFIIPLWLLGMTMLWVIKGELEILSFGIDESRLLGINTTKIIKIAIAANCILIGNVVAFAGMIGFLGFVIPHLIRLTVNANLRVMLPIASISGALSLVFFDSLSRSSFILIKSEIPVGALSALFLSPIFFFLLLKKPS